MSKVIELSPMLDLLGFCKLCNGTLKGIGLAVKVLRAVETDGDNVWAQVGLLWADVDKKVLETKIRSIDSALYMENIQRYHYLYGFATALLPNNNELFVNDAYIMLTNPVIRLEKGKSSIRLCNYSKPDAFNNFVMIPCKTAPINYMALQEDVRIVFDNIRKSSMNDLIKKNIFDMKGIQLCGNSSNVVNMPAVTHSTKIIVDDNDNIISRASSTDLLFGQKSDTIANLDEDYVVKNGRKYYNRKSFRYNDTFIKSMETLMKSSAEKVGSIVNKIDISIKSCNNTNINILKTNLVNGIITNLKFKPEPNKGITGFSLIYKVFNMAMETGLFDSVKGDEIAEYYENDNAISLGTDKIIITAQDRESVLGQLKESYTVIEVMENWLNNKPMTDSVFNVLHIRSNKFLMLFICVLLSVNARIVEQMDNSDSVFRIMSTNVYNLVFIYNFLSISDLDKLAMLMGVFDNINYEDSRCIAYLHAMMTDENDYLINYRTCVPIRELQNLRYGYEVTKMYHNKLLNNKGYAVDYDTMLNARAYLGLSNDNFKFASCEYVKHNNKILYVRSYDINSAIQAYVNSGLGIILDDGVVCIADYMLIQKEWVIFSRCKEICEREVKTYTDEEKQKIIEAFEEENNIKLEEKQKEAAMIDSNIFVLSGAAGTGKTTTAQLILYKLIKLEGYSEDEIMFVAPTGCAANRLKQVVKRKASTIHSFLRLGIGKSRTLFSLYDEAMLPEDVSVLIVDECSMITTDLMYSLITRLDTSKVKIIFLGDTAQLLPIGFGKPFDNMMHYLPCVTLEVSKRASESSCITANANLLLDNTLNDELVDGADFKKHLCSSDSIVGLIEQICKYYINNVSTDNSFYVSLSNVTQDDIFVVTPVKKEQYVWGSAKLNQVLRELFNPHKYGDLNSVYYNDFDVDKYYSIGDRVINLKNHVGATRYADSSSKIFKAEGYGITNGDVGKIKYILDGSEVTFHNDDETVTKGKKNYYYMFVEYKDVDIETNSYVNYLICYPLMKDSALDGNLGRKYVMGIDLAELDLAYALTAHKMQGSQARIIICPLLDLSYCGDFLCNNLLYTAITRAQSCCYLIGDVEGRQSVVNKMRHVYVLDKRLSWFDNY